MNAEIKRVQKKIDKKDETSTNGEVVVVVSNNHIVTPGHGAARKNDCVDDEVIVVDSNQNAMMPAHGAAPRS